MKKSFSRMLAIMLKELIQMRRDRMTFAMMIGVPIMQLVLFGFAINNDPKSLPTAIYSEENTLITRAILQGFSRSNYFDITTQTASADKAEQLMLAGEIAFIIEIPKGFSKQLIRKEKPQLLIVADASDPAASSNALAQANSIINQAFVHDFTGALSHLSLQKGEAVEVIIHRKFNPEGITQYNIVPGLLGVILTMTSVMITSMAMTRERERGNLENILAMPVKPYEVMLGKITPYVIVGAVQTTIILLSALHLFNVPFAGGFALLIISVFIFLLANLSLGFTFSTMAKTQMQAMQMTFFFFLPSILLSGFMFPFRGMPDWAQALGELLPLTHFLRIIRGIMLKGASFNALSQEIYALLMFTFIVGVLAIIRYKTTLD